MKGQDEVNITIEIKPDETPEVAEVFTVNLVNVSDMDRIQVGAVRIYILFFILAMARKRVPIFRGELNPAAHACIRIALMFYRFIFSLIVCMYLLDFQIRSIYSA